MRRLKQLLVVWLIVACAFRPQVALSADNPTLLASAQPLEVPMNAAPSLMVSLDYTDANLVTVLKGIAFSYDLNLIISNDIQGKVSAQLKNIPIDEALNAILGVNGYGFSRKGNIVYVMAKKDLEQSTELVALSYLKAEDAKPLLEKAISATGDIKVNESTNSLIVSDVPDQLKKLRELVKEIDVAPIQVLIEARIVDIKRSEVERLGTAINATYSSSNGDTTLNTGSSSKNTDGGQIKIVPRLTSMTADITIDALVQKDKARVLASPSIATINGQEAKIIIGDRVPYKKIQTSVDAAGGGTTNTSATEYVEVGTSLKVTPMVSPDGWITMQIHPEVSSVTSYTDDGAPLIGTREADATIRVKDRETIIIGGLISKNEDRSRNGVPGISSIPFLGWFFQRHSNSESESELTVFITPRIIYSPDQVQANKPRPEPVSNKLLPPQESVAPKAPVTISPTTPLGLPKEQSVFIDAKALGGDLDLLAGLIGYAETLERDLKENPDDALDIGTELIKTYKIILQQFPGTGKSEHCLYKICELYANVFGKCDAAKEALNMLRERSPQSLYVEMAESLVTACASGPGPKEPPANAQ